MAIILFTLGGLYALYEGYRKISDPRELSSPLIAVAGSVPGSPTSAWRRGKRRGLHCLCGLTAERVSRPGPVCPA